MSTVTAALVKELRDRTGVGMSKCKEALDHAQGDMEKAIEFLRKHGMASAVKKEGREAKEGVVAFHTKPDLVAICEINSETDFVATNKKFLEFANRIVEEIATTKPSSLELFLQQPCSHDPKITIDQYRSLIIQSIGENIQIRRCTILKREPNQSIGLYSHMNGKILTAVVLNGAHQEELAREIGMHVAAASPEYLNPAAVPQATLEKEREIAQEQVKGKPAYIMDKIVDGKINAFYDAQCLTRQKFIRDDALSVEEYVKKQGQLSGKEDLQVISFLRWALGQ